MKKIKLHIIVLICCFLFGFLIIETTKMKRYSRLLKASRVLNHSLFSYYGVRSDHQHINDALIAKGSNSTDILKWIVDCNYYIDSNIVSITTTPAEESRYIHLSHTSRVFWCITKGLLRTDPPSTPSLFSFNLSITSLNELANHPLKELLCHKAPLGKKMVVICTLGGDAFIVSGSDLEKQWKEYYNQQVASKSNNLICYQYINIFSMSNAIYRSYEDP